VTNGLASLWAYSEKDPATGKLQHHHGFLRCAAPYLQTKGYFEARLRLHMPAGIASAFWLMPPTMSQHANNPELWAQDGVELDILEYVPQLKGDYLPTLHWGSGSGTNHQSLHASAGARLKPGEWHTFGLLWDDAGYVFFCDGRQVARFTPRDKSLQRHTAVPVSSAPAFIQLTTGLQRWAGPPPPEGFGDRAHPTRCMDVHWVRTWKLAPAEPTVSATSGGGPTPEGPMAEANHF
jgi:beta-glucanase (GH16 family)